MSLLWWSYDSDDAQFKSLPAGPMLVPALIISAIVVALGATSKRHTTKSIAGPLAETSYWQARYARYQELIKKSVATNNNLELHESHELKKLTEYMRNPHGHPAP